MGKTDVDQDVTSDIAQVSKLTVPAKTENYANQMSSEELPPKYDTLEEMKIANNMTFQPKILGFISESLLSEKVQASADVKYLMKARRRRKTVDDSPEREQMSHRVHKKRKTVPDSPKKLASQLPEHLKSPHFQLKEDQTGEEYSSLIVTEKAEESKKPTKLRKFRKTVEDSPQRDEHDVPKMTNL